MNRHARDSDEGLVRAIGPRALGLTIINLTVGGGIFVLPGLIAAQLGAAAILAYLACSVAVALVFLCFAEVGSRITRSGGAYAYIEDAFGPFAGFIASVLLWFGWSVLSDAAITVAMVETMAVAVPTLATPVPRAIAIVALCGFLAWVNIIGVRSGLRLLALNTVAKLVPLVLLVVVGLFAVNIDFLSITEWPSVSSVGGGTLVLFFAFAGAEAGLHASGEITHPSKTVPRGLLIGLGGILLLYLGLQTVAQGVLGPALARNTQAPLAAVAEAIFGDWGSRMLLVAGVVSIYATVSGDILAAPRVVFASARDGNLPGILARVHPRYKTPYVSIIFFATVICVLALSGTFKPLAVVASGSILVVYGGVSLAVLRLRQRDGHPPSGAFTIPGGPAIPLLSCVVVGWLLWQLTATEALGLAALIGVAICLYAVRSVVRVKRVQVP
jgi:basic amino acid/polyamine antiporter, APA family